MDKAKKLKLKETILEAMPDLLPDIADLIADFGRFVWEWALSVKSGVTKGDHSCESSDSDPTVMESVRPANGGDYNVAIHPEIESKSGEHSITIELQQITSYFQIGFLLSKDLSKYLNRKGFRVAMSGKVMKPETKEIGHFDHKLEQGNVVMLTLKSNEGQLSFQVFANQEDYLKDHPMRSEPIMISDPCLSMNGCFAITNNSKGLRLRIL